MSVVLRPMRWWDIEQVRAIEAALFEADPWSVEQFWSELAQPTRDYTVATVGDDIVGYAGLFALPPDSDVQTIAVAQSAQGSGIGRRLLQRLIDTARDRGCLQLLLEVRSDNNPAIAMYEGFGFTRISRRRDYYGPGIDALIMRLRPIGGGHE